MNAAPVVLHKGVYSHTENSRPCCVRKPHVDEMLLKLWKMDQGGFSDSEEVYAITEDGTYPVKLITIEDGIREVPVWVVKVTDPEKYDRVDHEYFKVPEHRLYRPTVN